MIINAASYDIVVERGCLEKAGELLNLNRKVLVVTDSGVPSEYSDIVLSQCGAGSVKNVIEQGEKSKNFDTLNLLLEKMLDNGFARKDCVVAVGGGVVGDLSGFAASIYMRGIDFYNIPTTVLSQVDSSIGGKTAIDFGGFKNIVGSFYQPKKVLIDADALKTLDKRQINNGLAEAVKMSLTSDKALFELFENENPYENIEKIIIASLNIKNAVVTQDEKEAGLRKVLNFGHTIGHGIESLNSENGLYHGECVALGMIPMCSEEVRKRLVTVLEKLNLPTSCKADKEKVYEALLHDKKSIGDKITVSFVSTPGSFEFENVSPEDLKEKISMVVKESD